MKPYVIILSIQQTGVKVNIELSKITTVSEKSSLQTIPYAHFSSIFNKINHIDRRKDGLQKGEMSMARRGENIYKRKDGRWEGRYKAGYDANGKAKYRSVYFMPEAKLSLYTERLLILLEIIKTSSSVFLVGFM